MRGSPTPLELLEARCGTYRLLSRLVLGEIDEALAATLSQLPLFGEVLAQCGGVEALRDLRVEFAALFLMNAHPYGSVYTDESGMLNTDATAEVLHHYRESDFEPGAIASVGAPDHLGLELAFMAALVEREAGALLEGDLVQAAELAGQQQHFLEEHVVPWAPLLARLIQDQAESPLYRLVGESLETFVLGDFQSLAEHLQATS